MASTKLFKNGNSQAVRIPAELAYSSWDIEHPHCPPAHGGCLEQAGPVLP